MIEGNASTIRVLTDVCNQMKDMAPGRLSLFRLDDRLGGTSEVVHQLSVKRVLGEKLGAKMINAMKTKPFLTVPFIKQRLEVKVTLIP